MPACQARLPDGRLHFQHGPIDIVIGADGDARAVDEAHRLAWRRFEGVLEELVAEPPLLRLPIAGPCRLAGPIARRMWLACEPYRAGYITPMAAVAGAVAQELIAFYERGGIERAWVNDGGDIAWHLAPQRSLRVGLFADLSRLDADQILHGIRSDGQFDVTHEMPVRGVATSGWRGRSFSRGIADSVTVLARTAAEADAAATVIANAVDVSDERIVRRPACELKDDSDLGAIPVTVGVPPLGAEVARRALAAGGRCAEVLREAGRIWSCTLVCQGQVTYVGETQFERAADPNPILVHAAVPA
ncbi:MAG TPA: UPF0280 family protein [Burkholderiaceae bacterium]|nr:UPF0280 family protein [Burkholderiaceae bacterium]